MDNRGYSSRGDVLGGNMSIYTLRSMTVAVASPGYHGAQGSAELGPGLTLLAVTWGSGSRGRGWLL